MTAAPNPERLSPARDRALVVSLHDVSPHTWPASETILRELVDLGVTRTSLLVIPDHHRRGHFLESPGFCTWLREAEQAGHEIVMHGYYHQRARRSDESALQKLTTRVYTADEGEFFDLDADNARSLLGRARADFTKAGLSPRGFIAPAWLLSAEAESVLVEFGVEYTTRLGTVTAVPGGQPWHSQSLVWSVRSGWRRSVSLLWNASLFRRKQDAGLLRISVHPVDHAHPAIWRQIRQLVAQALEDREALTYHAWLTRQGVAASRS
jgi:predicted deacetylase